MSTTYKKIAEMQAQIKVMQAYEDGARIEHTVKDKTLPWLLTDEPLWDWDAYEYRVKQEPLTVWVNVYEKNGDLTFYSYEAEHLAYRCRSKGGRTVKMQEVAE
jgi:hypothetical protein